MIREPNMPFRAVLTRAGVRAALAAFDNGSTVAIAAVAAGDAAYSPMLDGDGRATQSRLRAERERGAARDGGETDGGAVRVRFLLDGSASFWVRELGFFLTDGTLFAVWCAPRRTLAWKHAETPLLLDFDISLGDMPRRSVTVESGRLPSAELLDFLAIALGGAPEVDDHG